MESYKNHQHFNGSEKKLQENYPHLKFTEDQSELSTWERSPYGPITEGFRKRKTSHTHYRHVHTLTIATCMQPY